MRVDCNVMLRVCFGLLISETATVIGTDRAWILPLIKTSAMAVQPERPSLGFFQKSILDLARQCDAFGANNPKAAPFHRARVIDLWSLLPCFCLHPTDLEEAFPSLSQTLIRAMGDSRYPELVVSAQLRLDIKKFS